MTGDLESTDPSGAPLEPAKVRALRVTCRLLVAGPLLFLALLFAAYGEHVRIVLGPVIVLIVAVASLLLIRLDRAIAAARLLAYGCWTAIALMALFGGGLHTPQLAAIPLIIVLAGWMLGPRHAIALTALSVLFGLTLAVMLHRGAPPPVPDIPAFLVWLPRAVVMTALCVLILYIVRSYENRLEEVRGLGRELSRSVTSLAAEKSQLRQIADNVPALIFHGDRELRCLFANRQFGDFFHGGGIPLEGLHLRAILGDAIFDAALPNLNRVLAGESVLLEGERLSKAEGMRHLEISLVPERAPDGAVVGFYALKRDVTERLHAEEAVRRLNEELEARVNNRTAELTAANRELESFAYSISHDLRAPLRGIDGFSHLLAEEYGERLDEQGRGYLERVRRAAQRMGSLIDDILELSRVTRQEMRRVRVDLSQIAAELLEERARSEPAHRVSLRLAPGCTAFGDPQLLRVMLQNLLENAWKYSAKTASPLIEFGSETAAGKTVYFVRDNGVGFDMRYADRLFTPFQRLHKPEEFEGTGIGLATVARVVHRHGGRVWAEAEPGKGTTIRFTLPS